MNNAGPIAKDLVITDRNTRFIFKSKNPCIMNCAVIVPAKVEDWPEASKPNAHIYLPALENVNSKANFLEISFTISRLHWI